MAEEALAGSETNATPSRTPLTLHSAVDALVEKREAETETEKDPVSEPVREPALEPVPDVDVDPDGSATEVDEEEYDYSLLAGNITSDDIETTDAEPALSLTLEHKGETREVTREEATRLAQMGLDYTKRSEALAASQREFEDFAQSARNTLETEIAEVRKTREALAARLASYTDSLQPPDPALADTDPEAYNAQAAKYDAALRKADADARELDRQNEEEREKARQRTDRAMAQHMQRLHTRVPAMKDQKVVDQVGAFLVKGMGFTKDDLVVNQRIHPSDSRFLEIAFMAKKYAEAQMKAKNLRAKAGKTASSKGTGGRTTAKKTPEKEAHAKLKKSGKPADAVEALMARRGQAS